MVARTIKTIVHEVVRIRGPAVRDHLSRVPASVDQENNPLLLQYIELMLENVQVIVVCAHCVMHHLSNLKPPQVQYAGATSTVRWCSSSLPYASMSYHYELTVRLCTH